MNESVAQIIWAVVGLLIGAVITWAVAKARGQSTRYPIESDGGGLLTRSQSANEVAT
jgi:hypothetical protein